MTIAFTDEKKRRSQAVSRNTWRKLRKEFTLFIEKWQSRRMVSIEGMTERQREIARKGNNTELQ